MWCAFQSVNNTGREMKTKMKKFPKSPFKLDCGDRPKVRQWLKDNGCMWYHDGCLSVYLLDKKYLMIGRDRLVTYSDSAEALNYKKFTGFNPFKKKSKLEKRVEALEEQVKSPGLLMKITEDLSSLPSFRCKTVSIKEEPKPVKVKKWLWIQIVDNKVVNHDYLTYRTVEDILDSLAQRGWIKTEHFIEVEK